MTTYTIPTTVAELVATSARLRKSATKASKLEAIHQLCSWVAWRANAIADMPADRTQAELADYLGVSGPQMSKVGGVAKCAHDVIVDTIGSAIAAHVDTFDATEVVASVTEAIDAINQRAQGDETWTEAGKERPCVSVDYMYKYLGLGKSGGESTYAAKLRKAAQQAQAENVSEADFIAAARQAWEDMRSAS
jgi:hypothetical protein